MAGIHTGATIGELNWLGGQLQEDAWFVLEYAGDQPRNYRIRGSQLTSRAQVMFCVPGVLSVDSDPAPWFICGMPNHIVTISSIAVVKTPSIGATVAYDIWRSPDWVTWTSIHTNSIPAGAYFSPESTAFTWNLIQHNWLLRLAVGGVGVTPAEDLTVSLRVYPS